MQLAGRICNKASNKLKYLTVRNTRTTAGQAAHFLQEVTGAECATTLRYLDLSYNQGWFCCDKTGESERQVDLLTIALARQTKLEKLVMENCGLTEAQKQQVMRVLHGRECCEVDFSVRKVHWRRDEDIRRPEKAKATVRQPVSTYEQ